VSTRTREYAQGERAVLLLIWEVYRVRVSKVIETLHVTKSAKIVFRVHLTERVIYDDGRRTTTSVV
jgi:hypothetical protein